MQLLHITLWEMSSEKKKNLTVPFSKWAPPENLTGATSKKPLYQLFAKIFGCLGFVLLFVSLVSPSWMKITTPHFDFTLGLWAVCVEKLCTKLLMHSGMIHVYRCMMVTTILIGTMAVATSFVSRLKIYLLPIITNAFTGILSLITLLCYGLWVSIKLLHDGHDFSIVFDFSWSFIMGCFGSSFFLTCGFLHILIEFETGSRIHHTDNEKPLTRSQDTAPAKNTKPGQGKRSLV